MSPVPPLAPDPTNRVADDPRAALLGEALFDDAGLSSTADLAAVWAQCGGDPDVLKLHVEA